MSIEAEAELDPGAGSDLHVDNGADGARNGAQSREQVQQRTQEQTDGATAEEVAHAKTLGWSPDRKAWEARNPGREHLWRGAKEFIRYGEQNRPVLIAEVRKLSDKINERDRRIAELESSTGELRDFVNKTQNAISQRQRENLLARKKQAREENDFEGEMAVDDELKKLEAAAAPKPREAAQSTPPEVQQFLTDNPWYGDGPDANPVLSFEATQIAKGLAAKGMKGKPLLDSMLKIVKSRFPDEFKSAGAGGGNADASGADDHQNNNGASRGSAVDGGGFTNGQEQRRSKAPTFDNLPADAKREAIKFEQKHKIGREAYAKQCLDAYGDAFFTGSPGDHQS